MLTSLPLSRLLAALLCLLLACSSAHATRHAAQHPFQAWGHGQLVQGDLAAASRSRTVIDLLNASPNHTIFVRLLQRARLIPFINKIQEFDDDNVGLTVLAPEDKAWPVSLQAKVGSQDMLTLSEEVLANALRIGPRGNVNEELAKLILYHFVDHSIAHEMTSYKGDKRLLATLSEIQGGREAQKIQMRSSNSSMAFGWAYADDRVQHLGRATGSIGRCEKGLLISLDRVLKRPESFYDIVHQHPELAYLRQILQKHELERTGQVASTTAFLPRSPAFDNLTSVERRYLESRWAIARRDDVRLLAWHLTAANNEILYSGRLQDASTVTMALGGKRPVSVEKASISIGGSSIVEADILTEHGVIHIVDGLLTPYKASRLALTIEKVLLASNASRFVELIHRAGLSSYINRSPEPAADDDSDGYDESFTFLVPMDDAIIRQRADGGRAKLADLVRYHFVHGSLDLKLLSDHQLLSTELRPQSLGGGSQRLLVHRGNGTTSATGDVFFGGVPPVGEPIDVGKDRIFFLSQLLEPPPDPMQIAVSTLTMSTFVAWIYSAGLEDIIQDGVALTGLIPTNAAFERLGVFASFLLDAKNRYFLSDVLKFHFLPRAVYSPDIAKKQEAYPTLQGETLDLIHSKRGNLSAIARGFSAHFLQRDLLTANGLLHEIDRLLLPDNLEVTLSDLMRAAKLDTMSELVKVSNFSWLLEKGGPYILLAPSADGFSRVNLTQLRSNSEALDQFVGLHIIDLSHQTDRGNILPRRIDQHLPLALKDAMRLRTLFSGKANILAVRRLSDREQRRGELHFQVGILGARGSAAGLGHATSVLSYGTEIRTANETRIPAGLFVVDAALEPYQPSWFFAWGWIPLAALFAAAIVAGALISTFRAISSKRRRQAAAEPLPGEEE